MKNYIQDYIIHDHHFDRKTWIAIFCLIIVTTGIFGFVYEFIFYYFNGGMKAFYWQGGNFLPWINIYAYGALLVFVIAYKRRRKVLSVLFLSMIATGLLEYLSGLAIYVIGNGARYWDYNTEILNFGNIDGFICFRSVMFFGISSLIFMYLLLPCIFYLAEHMNKRKFLLMSYIICFIFLADDLYNLIFAPLLGMPNAIKVYSQFRAPNA